MTKTLVKSTPKYYDSDNSDVSGDTGNSDNTNNSEAPKNPLDFKIPRLRCLYDMQLFKIKRKLYNNKMCLFLRHLLRKFFLS